MRQRLGIRRVPGARWNGLTGRGRTSLAALLAALVAVPAGAFPSLAVKPAPVTVEQPALWVLSDSDTTVYLFGTFHALDDRTDWFGRKVRAAFDSSDQLILETLVPTDPIELTNALARHSLAAPLVAGAPMVAESGASAFAASARQGIAAGRAAGMSVERGADAVLRTIADAQGKPVGGLESFDFQLGMFTSLPGAAPASGSATMKSPDAGQLMHDMRLAWQRGDSTRFAAVLGNLESQSPIAYRRLFADRNSDWASWIAQRMEQPGTVFVAVGTGHLIGRDSVQQKLASRGYRATRIH